jgi:hypothetical protein
MTNGLLQVCPKPYQWVKKGCPNITLTLTNGEGPGTGGEEPMTKGLLQVCPKPYQWVKQGCPNINKYRVSEKD